MAKLRIVMASWNTMVIKGQDSKKVGEFLHEVYSWELIYINGASMLHANKNGKDIYINAVYVGEKEADIAESGVFIWEFYYPPLKILGNSYLSEDKNGNQEVISF